jgi:hypothetical protein
VDGEPQRRESPPEPERHAGPHAVTVHDCDAHADTGADTERHGTAVAIGGAALITCASWRDARRAVLALGRSVRGLPDGTDCDPPDLELRLSQATRL